MVSKLGALYGQGYRLTHTLHVYNPDFIAGFSQHQNVQITIDECDVMPEGTQVERHVSEGPSISPEKLKSMGVITIKKKPLDKNKLADDTDTLAGDAGKPAGGAGKPAGGAGKPAGDTWHSKMIKRYKSDVKEQLENC